MNPKEGLMKEHRAPLWYTRTANSSRIFEGEGVQLSLSEEHIYDDTRFVFVRTLAYPGHAVEEVLNFLLLSVVRDPDEKVSGRTLWKGWLKWNGLDPKDKATEVAGIARSEILEHFRNTFNAGEMVRGRLNGDVQWIWRGFDLIDTGGRTDGTPSIQPTVEERSEDDDGPDIESARAVATLSRRTRADTWEYDVSGGGIVNGKIYTKDEDGYSPPERYEMILTPIGGDEA